AARFGGAEIDLFQNVYNPDAARLCAPPGVVRAVHGLPAPLTGLREYDGYFDLTAAPIPGDRPWLDGLLEQASVPPASVSAGARRNRLEVDAAAARELAPAVAEARRPGRPLLVVHPVASTPLRSFPPGLAARFAADVAQRTGWTVAVTGEPGAAGPGVLDWSGLSPGFGHFACLLAAADMLVSADTAAYHLADAFDVPAVALFTSIQPELRVAHYPYVEGIFLDPDERLLGLHGSDDPGLVAYAHSLWDRLDTGHVVRALTRATRQRAAAPASTHFAPDR
ncbi:MAG TPA: glycosyltransferase family 9 protein, partial [Longimicrobium sp.]|nr:glycosyltransferase family 9 protein [Longimicrobium sp.]